MSSKGKLLVASAAIAAGMTATPACAEGNYFSLFLGAASVEDTDLVGGFIELEFDTGYIAGASVGTHLSDNIRIEGELSYLAADADCTGKCAGEFESSALQILGNVWFDFAPDSSFQPYIGGGIGPAQVMIDDGSDEDDEWGWGYQVGGGIRLGETGAFDVSYRYRGVQAEIDTLGDDFEANAHVLQVGWTGEF